MCARCGGRRRRRLRWGVLLLELPLLQLLLAAVPARGGEEPTDCDYQPEINLVLENDRAISTSVQEVATDGIDGYTTYRVLVTLKGYADNIYAIFGDARPMKIPAARQATPCVSIWHALQPSALSPDRRAAFSQ